MVPAVGQTMQISDNYLNHGHLLPQRPRIDGNRVPPSHTKITSYNSVSQRSRLTVGRRGVLWSPRRCLPGRPPTSPTATAVGGVCGRPRRLARPPTPPWRCRWSHLYLTLMSLNVAYYFSNWYRRFADTDSPMFQHAPMLPISDVYIGRTLVYRGHCGTLFFLPGIISLFIMCIGN